MRGLDPRIQAQSSIKEPGWPANPRIKSGDGHEAFETL
jgi:hypothetical protein